MQEQAWSLLIKSFFWIKGAMLSALSIFPFQWTYQVSFDLVMTLVLTIEEETRNKFYYQSSKQVVRKT